MKFVALLLIFSSFVALFAIFSKTPQKAFASHSRVDLLTTDNFAVLAGTAITGTNTNVITGNVGLDPGGGASITLLTCAEMASGTIYDNNGGYAGGGGGSTACRVTDSDLLTTAKNDLVTAYNDAAGRTTTSQVATELGGTTLTDGTYDSASGTFGITGTLTLNGQGNSDAVFIFKMATTLTTANSSQVVLTNGAQACNVYWQVGSSATLGTSTTLLGNVLALTTITDSGSSTVNGRLLARNGAVNLNNTTLTKQTCTTPTSTPASTSSSTSSNASSTSSTTGGTTVGPDLGKYITPTIIESSRVDSDSIFISWAPYSGIETFIVQYGFENGTWLYSTNVTGFSTTINDLPANLPIWVRIAPRDNISIGDYGEATFIGGPRLPNTGYSPRGNTIPGDFLPFYLTSSLYEKQVKQKQTQSFIQYPDTMEQILGIVDQKEDTGFPVRLKIPSINVDAVIQYTGLTTSGDMEVPSNTVDVGWFNLGPRPGKKGSAVIAGHFDGEKGKEGVFTNLDKLKQGDKLYIEDDTGTSIAFVVRESRIYDPGYAEEVFSLNDSAHLNLITCDGLWDGAKKSYSKRLVVSADITN